MKLGKKIKQKKEKKAPWAEFLLWAKIPAARAAHSISFPLSSCSTYVWPPAVCRSTPTHVQSVTDCVGPGRQVHRLRVVKSVSMELAQQTRALSGIHQARPSGGYPP